MFQNFNKRCSKRKSPKITSRPGADPGFAIGGVPTLKEAQTYDFAKFSKKK